jgi:hypothetical protein
LNHIRPAWMHSEHYKSWRKLQEEQDNRGRNIISSTRAVTTKRSHYWWFKGKLAYLFSRVCGWLMALLPLLLLLCNPNLLLLLGFLYRRLRYLGGCVAFCSTSLGPLGGLPRHVWVAQAAFVPSLLLLVFRRWLRTMLTQRECWSLAAAVLRCTSEPRHSLPGRTWKVIRIGKWLPWLSWKLAVASIPMWQNDTLKTSRQHFIRAESTNEFDILHITTLTQSVHPMRLLCWCFCICSYA